MKKIQETHPLKVHLIENGATRPLCGRMAWRGHWQVVMDGIKAAICKNCIRVIKSREIKNGNDHDEH